MSLRHMSETAMIGLFVQRRDVPQSIPSLPMRSALRRRLIHSHRVLGAWMSSRGCQAYSMVDSHLISVVVGSLSSAPTSCLLIFILVFVFIIPLQAIMLTLPQLQLGSQPFLLPLHCKSLKTLWTRNCSKVMPQTWRNGGT